MVYQQLFPLFLSLFFAGASPSFGQSTPDEYGIASYYGDEFHGRKTASGQKYNKNELTCAHKTLPFGTKVRVTRLDTKNSVIVRVNDRGPYIKGYVVDLSRAAAAALEMIKEGVVKVKIEVLETGDSDKRPEERTTDAKNTEKAKPEKAAVPEKESPKAEKNEHKPEAENKTEVLVTGKNFKSYDLYKVELKRPEKSGFGVQVATLNNPENVFSEIAKLQGTWGSKVLVSIEQPKSEDEKPFYKIIIGPFKDKKSAERNQKSAAKKGYKKCFVVDLADLKK